MLNRGYTEHQSLIALFPAAAYLAYSKRGREMEKEDENKRMIDKEVRGKRIDIIIRERRWNDGAIGERNTMECGESRTKEGKRDKDREKE